MTTRRTLRSLVLPVAYLALAVFLGSLSLERPLQTPWLVMVLLGVAGVGILLLRRRRPTLAFLLTLPLTLVSFASGSLAESMLLLAGLYAAGARDSARVAWGRFGLAAGAGALGAVVLLNRMRIGPPFWAVGYPSRSGISTDDVLNIVFFLAVPMLMATLIGLNVGHRRRYLASLVERAEQMKRERDQQASIATAAERERIAREMHDVIAHSLAVMIAMADGAQAAADKRPAESKEAIGRVAETGRRTLTEVRRLLGRVRGDVESAPELPQPGAAQVPSLVEEFRSAGLPVELGISGALPEDSAVGLTVYRIVQESLTNVLRHAGSVRRVVVRLTLDHDRVDVLVEDESAPAAISRDPGRGLLGMRERAALYDGDVETGPRPGGGWRVHVRLPVRSDGGV